MLDPGRSALVNKPRQTDHSKILSTLGRRYFSL